MNKFVNTLFLVSISSWFITLAITPVGGWALSNPYREYYMNTFCITGVLTLLSLGLLAYVNNRNIEES